MSLLRPGPFFSADTNVILSFFPILAPRATIYPMTSTAGSGDLSVPYRPLVIQGITIQGTVCPSRSVHTKMLRFAAVHGIKPITQEFPLTTEGIEEAMTKLDKGEVRYRAVLVAGKL